MTRVITAPVATLAVTPVATPVAQVAVDELDLRFASLRLVCPAQVASLSASVRREGIRQPVLAASAVEPQRLVLIDGFKRVRVARELGITHVSATLLAIDGPMALCTMLRANAPNKGISALEEGWIVRRLCREHGLTQAKAGALLSHEQSWVSHRLRLVEQLEEELQEDLRLGLLAPAVARELGRLPRASQTAAATVVREHGLLSRQAARLVRNLLDNADPRVRQEILADPLRYTAAALAAERAKARTSDCRLNREGNALRQSLLGFEGAASRLECALHSHAAAGLGGEQTRILAPLLRQATAAGSRALTQLNEVCRAHALTDSAAAVAAAAAASAPAQGMANA